jgi:hypothetical protein
MTNLRVSPDRSAPARVMIARGRGAALAPRVAGPASGDCGRPLAAAAVAAVATFVAGRVGGAVFVGLAHDQRVRRVAALDRPQAALSGSLPWAELAALATVLMTVAPGLGRNPIQTDLRVGARMTTADSAQASFLAPSWTRTLACSASTS